jgi:hypothetical protein
VVFLPRVLVGWTVWGLAVGAATAVLGTAAVGVFRSRLRWTSLSPTLRARWHS